MICYLMLLDSDKERDKFEQIYQYYRLKMQYVAASIVKDKQAAENMVHDTFLTLTENMDKIGEAECHKTWNYIVTILKNKCFNYLKREKKLSFGEDYAWEENGGDALEEQEEKKERAAILTEEIRALSYPYKEVLYLTFYNELNSKEIGEMLGMSSDNVRKILSRAKQKLRKRLEERGITGDE